MSAVQPSDPFAVLGVPRTASFAEVREARRRLALELHPDRGGDLAAMQRVNAAFDACLAMLNPDAWSPASVAAPDDAAVSTRVSPRRSAPRRPRVDHDSPSFTVDAPPAETFEALLVVASWIGEVIDDDPPYALECQLIEPAPCWCRLELVADAGASTVSLTVASANVRVSAELVRDVWVEHLNQLGRRLP